jgi:zinc protease
MAARAPRGDIPRAHRALVHFPDHSEDRMRPLRISAVAMLATIAIISFAVAPHSARAQALPTAKELMDKNDAAIGGRAALDKHSSYHQVGTMSIAAMGNMEGQIELFKMKPARYLQKIVLGPGAEVTQGYDGKTAWAILPGQGPTVLDSATAETFKSLADFHANFHDMARYKSAENAGIVDFEGKKCYRVKIVRVTGGEGSEFYDIETGLIAGIQAQQDTPMGKIDQTSAFSEYKEFGGLKFPTKIQQKNSQFDATITFTAIEFDKVDPAVFELPEAVKAKLKP